MQQAVAGVADFTNKNILVFYWVAYWRKILLMKQNQYTLLLYIYPYHCFTANICATPLQAIIAVKCHLSLILSGHRRVYLANCVCVSGQGRPGPCVLCAFDIFLNKNISQIQQCHMVPAGRQPGGGCYGGRGAATTHVSRAKWEMIKASVWLQNCTCSSCCPHMERVCMGVCVGEGVYANWDIISCYLQYSAEPSRCAPCPLS